MENVRALNKISWSARCAGRLHARASFSIHYTTNNRKLWENWLWNRFWQVVSLHYGFSLVLNLVVWPVSVLYFFILVTPTHKWSEWALSCGDKYVVAEDPAGCSENGKMMKWSKHIIERAVIDSIWVKLCILFLLHVLVESGQNQDKRNKEFACLKVNLEIFFILDRNTLFSHFFLLVLHWWQNLPLQEGSGVLLSGQPAPTFTSTVGWVFASSHHKLKTLEFGSAALIRRDAALRLNTFNISFMTLTCRVSALTWVYIKIVSEMILFLKFPLNYFWVPSVLRLAAVWGMYSR